MFCGLRVPPFLLGQHVPLTTSQWDSIIFHSLLLIRTLSFWLLEFTLIHFAISASTSDSIQSSLRFSQHWLCSCPQWLGKVWLAFLYSMFSPSFSLCSERWGFKGRGMAFPAWLPAGSLLASSQDVITQIGLLTWVCYGEVETQQASQGLVRGSQQLLSFVSLDHIFQISTSS